MIFVLMTVLIGITLLVLVELYVIKKEMSLTVIILTGFTMITLMLITLSFVIDAVVAGQIPI